MLRTKKNKKNIFSGNVGMNLKMFTFKVNKLIYFNFLKA